MKAALAIASLLLAGLAGTFVTIRERDADSAFEFRQKNPLTVQPRYVQEAVLAAPEPAPDHQTRARRARCTPGSAGDIQNPWRCVVRYGSGRVITYDVQIEADGSFYGSNHRLFRITGCCVRQAQISG